MKFFDNVLGPLALSNYLFPMPNIYPNQIPTVANLIKMLIKMSKANWIPTVANLMQVLIKMSKKGTRSSQRVQQLHDWQHNFYKIQNHN